MTTALLGLLFSITSLSDRVAPAGTPLHIRLTATVGSYASKAESPVSAVLIAIAVQASGQMGLAGAGLWRGVQGVSKADRLETLSHEPAQDLITDDVTT